MKNLNANNPHLEMVDPSGTIRAFWWIVPNSDLILNQMTNSEATDDWNIYLETRTESVKEYELLKEDGWQVYCLMAEFDELIRAVNYQGSLPTTLFLE